VARLLDEALPLPDGQTWYAYGQPVIVIASRFPISMQAARTHGWGGGVPRTQAMALLNLPDSLAAADLHVVCAHLQSRSQPKDILARQPPSTTSCSPIRCRL